MNVIVPTETQIAHSYCAYGFDICSELSLPELSHGGPARIGMRKLRIANARVPRRNGHSGNGYVFDETGSTFWWQDVGAFHVSPQGDRVSVDREDGVPDDLLAFPILGPILSEVLRRNGLFVLHASAAAIDGAGIALLADKGTGKSTTAGALLRSGAPLLADDLVAIDPISGVIRPGFAQIKLAEADLAHQTLCPSWVVRPFVHDKIDKRRVLLPGGLAQTEVPARRIYVLERGDGPEAEFLDIPAEARLPALLRFAFAPRFGTEALRGADAAAHFSAAVRIAGNIPVRRLRTPCGHDRLPGLIDAIRADLATDEGDLR
ncbi:serine kinase [Salipiger abyssi]|uniref:serine kinase n=1 Tax=Salipiger abyssi TaxID=1250539 RepID=UPI001A8F2C5F|nr:serine kinase [Salipiger abyssi]MBN9886280.1 serine kinase [Salipiger abyssi]